MKDSDIASAILDKEGLTGEVEDTPVTHAEMVQFDCTDWDFLVSRIESVGFVTVAHEWKNRHQKTTGESTALADAALRHEPHRV